MFINKLVESYDSVGRLNAISDSRGKMLWSCSYDAAGRRTQTTGLYGLTTNYDYEDVAGTDNRGLYLDGITHTLGAETINFEYERDLSGNITTKLTKDTKFDYLYDKNYSLKSVIFEDETELVFTYDNLFNRVSTEYELDTTNYTLDNNGLNQYASIDSETLEYDLNGNLIQKGNRHFLYDSENQLLATYNLAGEPNETQVSLYSYDEFGRRISKAVATGVSSTSGAVVESYLYDGFQAIGEYDESGEYIRRRFIYAAGIDEPIAMVAEPAHQGFFGFDEFSTIATSWLYDSNDIGFNADADLNFDGVIDLDDLKIFAADFYLDERPLLESPKYYGYVFDGLGSVVALTFCNDPNQTGDPNELPYFVETYEYDAFGDVSIYDPNDTLLTQSAIGNPYMFTGRRLDSESGLYYYRFRMYDSELGRFLQTDPIGYYDSMNLYQYCGNNPTNYIDPWGLRTVSIGLTGTGSVGMGGTIGFGLIVDRQGVGVQYYTGYGYTIPNLSAGIEMGWTNASSMEDVVGGSFQVGAGVLIFGLEGTTTDVTDLNPNATKCPNNKVKIEGGTGSISYSILPIDAHVTATNTKIKRLFNWRTLWPFEKGDD